MKRIFTFLILLSALGTTKAQTPVALSSQPSNTYTENFSDIANWTNGFAAGTGASAWGAVTTNATGTIPDGTRISAATSTFVTGSSGGVQKGSAQSPSTTSILLLSTGSTDNTSSTAIDFFVSFTGLQNGKLSFDWSSVNNSTGDRKSSLRVYTSTDGTTFTELTAAQVLNFTNNSVTSGSITTVDLPSSFNNTSTCRIRFYYHNGSGGTTGSRPKISIDNLTVSGSVVTPISLVKFEAEKLAEKVKLSWTTATEINNAKFIVERAAEGEDFTAIAEVKGAGNSKELNSYSLVDANPLKGTAYYRLTQVDFDGTSTSFEPVAVKMSKGSLSMEQGVGSGEQGAWSIYSPIATQALIDVKDLNGKVIYSEIIQLKEGYQTYKLKLDTHHAGIYVMQLIAGKESVTKKVKFN